MQARSSNLLPEGTHLCRLEGRHRLTDQTREGRDREALELAVLVIDGVATGHRTTFRVFGRAKMDRAKRMRQGAQIVVTVVHVALDSGRSVSRVADFHAADEPSVVEAMGNGAPIATARSTGPNDLPPEEVPGILLQRLRRAVREGGLPADPHGAAVVAIAPPPPPADEYPIGFHLIGATRGLRTLVDFEAVLADHADCGPTVVTGMPGFISLFQYAAAIADHKEANNGSLAGFRGRCWSRWVAIDLDGDGTDVGLNQVLADAKKVVDALLALAVPTTKILVFFSGRRGIHILWPSQVFAAGPKDNFEAAVRLVCRAIAGLVGVEVDSSIYNPLAAMRAPNTRHEGTGLYKVAIPLNALSTLDAAAVQSLARQPSPFTMPDWRTPPVGLLHELWRWACGVEASHRRLTAAVIDADRRIFGDTFDLICHGAPEGSRGTRFFRAAANLLDFDCPEPLLRALLEPAARLCGYPDEDLENQIRGAITAHERRPTTPS